MPTTTSPLNVMLSGKTNPWRLGRKLPKVFGEDPLSLDASALLVTGARALVFVNSVLIAFATNVSAREMYNRTPVDTIDSYLHQEFAPGHIDVSVTLGLLRVVGRDLKSEQAGTGCASTVKLVPNARNFGTLPPMTITILDIPTNTVIYTIRHAKAVSKEWNLARAILMENVQFVGKMIDEEYDTVFGGVSGLAQGAISGSGALK